MKSIKSATMRNILIIIAAAVLCSGMAGPAAAQEEKAQELVDRCEIAFNSVINDPNMIWLRQNLKDAKGVLIVPSLLKGGFIWGGTGGSGVLLVREDDKTTWSYPGFYTLGSVTFGPQIGGAASEVIMLVRTRKAMDKLLSTSFKLGGDTTIAAGPVGAGARANVTADIVSFAKSKGAYAGASLEGSMIKIKDDFNESYYGRPVTPVDIFVKNQVENTGADELRSTVATAATLKSQTDRKE